MSLRFLSDLIGTLEDYFRVGLNGFRLKNSTGVAEVRNPGDTAYASAGVNTVQIHGSNASNSVSLTAPAGLSGNVTFTLPGADGSAGQVMKTDGSGNLSFVAATSNGVLSESQTYTQASTSPVAIFTPPANSEIVGVINNVASAAAGGSPTICVGVVGTTGRDMATTQSDLKTQGIYEVTPLTAVGGTPAEMIITIVPDGQTFSGTIIVLYSNPA